MSHEVKAAPRPSAKFFYLGSDAAGGRKEKFFLRGATYGTFAPNDQGGYPSREQLAVDFALMRHANINTLRIYTEPPRYLMDEAQRHGLRVIVGLAWMQHVCFLDSAAQAAAIRDSVRQSVRRLKDHPALFAIALGNEIPAAIVRWHGKEAIENFLHALYDDVKSEAPHVLCTYVNFPPTDYLDLSFLDFVCFNVFLHKVKDFQSYLAKLQHIAGNRPLVLSEVGMDSIREGEAAQSEFLGSHIRAAFAAGAAGVCVFSFTDDWWRGGSPVLDWSFGLVDAQRRPKPALATVREHFAELPFTRAEQASWPKVSVVICAYNAASTLEDNLSSLSRLDYPNYEVIVVNDGSTDATPEIAARYPFRMISVPNGGLSAARNLGLHAASGEIVAYTDADTRVDQHWLSHLVQSFIESTVAGVGGPNVVPPDDGWIAQCVARSPGGPVHVMLDNTEAEHIPGCNMAYRKSALEAVGGFDPTYIKAGDDVDICWRLQAHGHSLGFAPGALVWHHHRDSVKAYWRQQVGYGEGESFLQHRHTDRFNDRGHVHWAGRIYSPLPAYRSLFRQVVYQGRFGCEPFPSIYQGGLSLGGALPQMVEWQMLTALMLLASSAGVVAARASAVRVGGHAGRLRAARVGQQDRRRRPARGGAALPHDDRVVALRTALGARARPHPRLLQRRELHGYRAGAAGGGAALESVGHAQADVLPLGQGVVGHPLHADRRGVDRAAQARGGSADAGAMRRWLQLRSRRRAARRAHVRVQAAAHGRRSRRHESLVPRAPATRSPVAADVRAVRMPGAVHDLPAAHALGGTQFRAAGMSAEFVHRCCTCSVA